MFEGFLDHYAGMLGGIAIATSTMIAVFLKRHHFKSTENHNARYHGTSFASAIAAELIDNADRLAGFYLQISQATSKKRPIVKYQQLDVLAYETMLDRIGRLGPALSFMVVDVYGDIRALKVKYDHLETEDILKRRDEYLQEIQVLMVKTISCAAIMYFYADYMSGRKWLKLIASHRVRWLEREMEKFLEYVGKTDSDFEFLSGEDAPGVNILKRVADEDKRQILRNLFSTVGSVLYNLHKCSTSETQLALRGMFYTLKNSLLPLLDIQPNAYDLRSEREYGEFLPLKKRSISAVVGSVAVVGVGLLAAVVMVAA